MITAFFFFSKVTKGTSHKKARIVRRFVIRFFGSRNPLLYGEEKPDDQTIFNQLEVPEELKQKVWDAIGKQQQKVSRPPVVDQAIRVDKEGTVFSHDSGISTIYSWSLESQEGKTNQQPLDRSRRTTADILRPSQSGLPRTKKNWHNPHSILGLKKFDPETFKKVSGYNYTGAAIKNFHTPLSAVAEFSRKKETAALPTIKNYPSVTSTTVWKGRIPRIGEQVSSTIDRGNEVTFKEALQLPGDGEVNQLNNTFLSLATDILTDCNCEGSDTDCCTPYDSDGVSVEPYTGELESTVIKPGANKRRQRRRRISDSSVEGQSPPSEETIHSRFVATAWQFRKNKRLGTETAQKVARIRQQIVAGNKLMENIRRGRK